ncbi:ferredoxin [Candidatus Woesearchaeota archaeon CG_4_10_14_0_2_um_filter_57_5]|nr:MAG: hypothetical protein AUJ68_03005 [Candidatus Woesearchaeota archaeon CG1_02_57_44]PIN68092.1 MAG: ferredoxin [Candidatus Woesearchaeota archaeon CG11_big_fil_rev_8_21_14_0_20_57_5]PIZ50570.1 MAG: ferredoxin [Candidatus Woesearchaeota archaeon CG_4_10_14_0_2_um_filter_57_5]
MPKYCISHNRPDCIGCGACAAIAPKKWHMDDEGKSHLEGSSTNDDGWELLDISDDEFQEQMDAAESCPVNVIHIKNLADKKELI